MDAEVAGNVAAIKEVGKVGFVLAEIHGYVLGFAFLVTFVGIPAVILYGLNSGWRNAWEIAQWGIPIVLASLTVGVLTSFCPLIERAAKARIDESEAPSIWIYLTRH